MERCVRPEILDELDPSDPRAATSRRDLRRINRLVGHDRRIAAALLDSFPGAPPARLVDLGAGDGFLAARVAHRLSARWKYGTIVLVDRMRVVAPAALMEIERTGWRSEIVVADVMDWLESASPSGPGAVYVNFFLHHLEPPQLRRLFELVARSFAMLVACEPRRTGMVLGAGHLLGLMGCNEVTRHDAVVSIRAGFRSRELSGLWPAAGEWRLREHRTGLFSHQFIAVREGAGSHPRNPRAG